MINGEKFNRAIQKIVEGYGVIPSDTHYKWSVNTKYGKLYITVHEPEKRQKLFSVFCRFDDPDKAKSHTDCNPYSGKWNFHYSNMNACINIFRDNIEKIVI